MLVRAAETELFNPASRKNATVAAIAKLIASGSVIMTVGPIPGKIAQIARRMSAISARPAELIVIILLVGIPLLQKLLRSYVSILMGADLLGII